MPSERAFVDYFANHPSTEAEFPATKPDDAGREKTMYIVLEKVDTNLDHFLRTEEAENLRNIFRMVHGTLVSFSTGQSINELENGPSSYRQKGIYFEWVFMK